MAPRATKFIVPLSLVASVLAVTAVSRAATPPSPQTERARLQTEKLRQEVRQLRISNDYAVSVRKKVLDAAPFVTVLIGVFGVGWPVARELAAQRRQRDMDREQRANELEQRRVEAGRRFQESFAAAVANLGSKTDSVRVSAAVALQSFLTPEYEAFHDQVFSVLCANLTVEDHPRIVNRFLVRAFSQALRLRLAADAAAGRRGEPLDLAHCQMRRVDLHGLDLTKVDLAFAYLRGANLVGTVLKGAQGIEVVIDKARLSLADLQEAGLNGASAVGAMFHKANLVSVRFAPSENKAADLTNAEFYEARMQGAILVNANLRGARFDGANIADAHLRGAVFDETSLRSILRSSDDAKGNPSWRNADFDPDVTAMLEGMAKRTR
jgi:uncharacterized protein YjbI with pentapeptide repeats